MSLSGNVQIRFSPVESGSQGLAANLKYPPVLDFSWSIADGTGAGKAQKVGSAEITLGGSPTDLALSPSTLEDVAGDAITFAKIKAIMLVAPSANAGDLTIGADAAAWDTLLNATGTLTLKPNSCAAFACQSADGWAVSASDVLQIAGTSGDKLQIIIIGEV